MYSSKPYFFIPSTDLGNVLDGVLITILKEKINFPYVIP